MEFTSIYSPSSKFTDEGLLIVESGWKDVGIKILDSELFLRQRINEAMKQGKRVLLLPGSYDILHVGHVTWIDQTLAHLLNANLELKRKDIFVVVPINSDNLVNVGKRHMHQSLGGTEKITRPVITQDHRLLALANLASVDLTVAIPSPLHLDAILPQPNNFSITQAHKLLDISRAEKSIHRDDYKPLCQSLATYEVIKEAKGYKELLREFKRLVIPTIHIDKVASTTKQKTWDETTWEIMWHLYLSDEAYFKLPSYNQSIQRIVSKRDGYGKLASYIAKLSGISVDMIMDTHLTSTTELISTYGNKTSELKDLVASTNTYNLKRQ